VNPNPGSQPAKPPVTPTTPGTPQQTPPVGAGTGSQTGNGLDPLDSSLFNDWSSIMGGLGHAQNDPNFQAQVQGLSQQLNDKYYQQWLTQRDKMGGQGLGQSGFLNNDQLREQMAEQNDLSGQYGTLLKNYLTNQLSQATNYSDMMKTMMPYSNMTLDQKVVAQQNAQKLADAQLNAAGYANVSGNYMPTIAGEGTVGTQTGLFTNPYTGGTSPTASMLNQSGLAYSIDPKTGQITLTPTETASNNAATQTLGQQKLQLQQWMDQQTVNDNNVKNCGQLVTRSTE
jgi:hypothetical protein